MAKDILEVEFFVQIEAEFRGDEPVRIKPFSMTKTRPRPRASTETVKVVLTVPKSVFRMPTAEVELNVPEKPGGDVTGEVQR